MTHFMLAYIEAVEAWLVKKCILNVMVPGCYQNCIKYITKLVWNLITIVGSSNMQLPFSYICHCVKSLSSSQYTCY